MFVFGVLILLVVLWYWQKSTNAEEGALDLLDRLAAAEKKTVTANKASKSDVKKPATISDNQAEDLTRVKGIGPIFARRLAAAEIVTLKQLNELTAAKLADVLNISESRAEDILQEAKALAVVSVA